MSFPLPPARPGDQGAADNGLHVPAGIGITRWVFGDTYTAKLTAEATNGSIGLIEASVPPGGGPVTHTHVDEDETFCITSGELEFRIGDRTLTAHSADVVFVPRTLPHRFRNTGLHAATMYFLYTPGGTEGLFVEGGDIPEPGRQAPLWGPERVSAFSDLMAKYGVEVTPES